MKISSNIIDDSINESDFLHKLLLTNTQVSMLQKTFGNGSSANLKLSKTWLDKMGQSGEFLGRSWGPLLKTRLPLKGNVLRPLVKSVLISVGLIEESLEESGLLIKGLSEIIKNQARKQKGRFLIMFLGTLGASLLGNLLAVIAQLKQVNEQLEQVKVFLEQVRIFNAVSSFNKFWNTKVS